VTAVRVGEFLLREVAGAGIPGIMKKVESGGPVRAIAFPQANAGLPDTIPLN
jgi:hypothetical protein